MHNSKSPKTRYVEKEEKSIKILTKDLAGQIPKTINHFFPDFIKQMQKIKDHRKKTNYELKEILMASIVMYILKEGSRNCFNNDRQEKTFRENYRKLFGMGLPHMDTVDDVYRVIKPEEIEKFKVSMIRELLEKKVLENYRLKNKYYIVAIDGTGVMSFSGKHCDKCLTKQSSYGKTTWFHNVLEAKLVCPNGLTISMATEWIENENGEYEKQDCEQKAFKRLAKKLKKNFPRLPICLVGDSLYPNQSFFEICRNNKWEYILTLKEGSLKSVWEEVELLLPITEGNKEKTVITTQKKTTKSQYRWINGINYRDYIVNWLETKEIIEKKDLPPKEEKRFVHLGSLPISLKDVSVISQAGRLRWKIENEGFNKQKNHGYALEHKYSRVSLQAAKNYYQSLQIACIINQLIECSKKFRDNIKGKLTIKHLWKNLLSFLLWDEVDQTDILKLLNTNIQIRLE